MYVVRKSDKKTFELREAVKYKTLWNKAEKLEKEINDLLGSLIFQCEDEETKQHLFNALHQIECFQQNLKLRFEVI